jgi:ribosome biogenesis GTPase
MELAQLGWNRFFLEHFEGLKGEGHLPGRIARQDRQLYVTYCELGEIIAQISGRMRYRAASQADLPAVGDWVVLEPHGTGDKAVIRAVLPRRSKFCRKVASVKTVEQVLATNIDHVFLVSGLDRDFNPRRIERYLTVAWESGAKPVVVLNKADLCAEIDAHVDQVDSIALGAPVHVVSALTMHGLQSLRQYLDGGSTIALLGSSGVGKSSLINSLVGHDLVKTGAVRQADGKGRHITTSRQLISVPGGGLIIDTPGMREFQLWADEGSLEGTFDDIDGLAAACRFRDCQHQTEPGCAVRAAIEAGKLDSDRLRSYVKLKKELRFLAVRKDQRARLGNKAKAKDLARRIRQHKKQNRYTRRHLCD